MRFKPLWLVFIPLLFASCAAKDTRHIDTSNLPTHNKAVFDEGRYCSDYLKFECLPDSRDSMILNGNEPLAEGKVPFYEWDEKKYNNLVRINDMEDKERKEKMEHYVLTKEDYAWMANVRLSQWYKEMEATMEKQYPGFWGDTPRVVRHRWMRLCVAKGNKYGYGLKTERVNDKGEVFSKDPNIVQDLDDFPIKRFVLDKEGKPKVIQGEAREMQQWIELCGRIGLNFDRDSKWQYIVDFIKHPDSVSMGHAGEAVKYIDFSVFGKDNSRTGTKFTGWSLQTSLRHLPYPSRPVPRLND